MSTDSKAKEEIAKRLRWARKQAGLSQGQVARLLGVHRPTISQIESGDRSLKADEIQKFAEMYDVKDSWIVSGDAKIDKDEDAKLTLAARELKKLRKEDLDTILQLVRILRSR